MSSSSLLESGTRQSPPQHKHDQVQAFDENVRWLERFNEEQFLEYLGVSNSLIPSEIPDLPQSLSIDGFCSMANDIAQSIKATREYHLLCIYLFLTAHDFSLDFQKSDLLVFKDTGNKIPNGHVPGIMCRPDITAAFEKGWINDFSVAWAVIRLAGEHASKGKSSKDQIKNAATYLHYLLLARPDFLVTQGLLTTTSTVMFLVGIGGVGIRQLTVEWSDENLYKFLYVSISRLYHPSHLADPSYTRIKLNKETSEVTYTVQFKLKEYGLCSIHARNPFMTRTHVLSNPSPPTKEGDGFPTILK